MDYNSFLQAVEPQHHAFVQKIHEDLIASDYKIKIESKATGFFITYTHPKTKRSLLNLFFRKSGLMIRFYPESVFNLTNLPEMMVKAIENSLLCKDCNPKCIKGYRFSMNGTDYYKCRYNCFQFAVTDENKNILTEWVNL